MKIYWHHCGYGVALSVVFACGRVSHDRTDENGGVGGSEATGGQPSGDGGQQSLGGGQQSLGGRGAGEGGRAPVPCTNPSPSLVNGRPSGIIRCAEQYLHREEQVRCESFIVPEEGPHADAEIECEKHSDCEGELAFCDAPQSDWFTTECVQGCAEDSDCQESYVCICDLPAGRCIQSNCSTDADCGNGELCLGKWRNGRTPTISSLVCTSERDECLTTADCSGEDVRCMQRYDYPRVCEEYFPVD